MVLQAERYNGGYQQQSYSAYQGSNGGYNAYKSVTEYSTPYTGSFQASTYPLNHGPPNQSGWSSGGDHYGTANHHFGGGTGVPVKPTIGTYESSYYDNSYPHGNSNNYGSPLHQSNGGHENPHGSYNQSHGNSHRSPHGDQGQGSHDGFGKTSGFGGGVYTHQINKLTHGHNSNTYGTYGHNPSGYDKPYWIVKGLDDDE
ncbi:hypothetical protein E3N88_37335 [Mikania micrantha]|uniref:Uncharacterized protein n=1 Tax=Mikania micrantha TaxID=192012 RepID=A0A5N6LQW5_9ASTR|nr:hypothetical protein E3N88_37335 [Mikania micrantha]